MGVSIANILLAPVAAALVGFAVWYFQSRINKLHAAQAKLQDERRKVYSDVLSPMIRAFAGAKTKPELQKALREVTSFEYKKTVFEFNLIGSDDVVRAFNDMMQYFYHADSESSDVGQLKETLKRWAHFCLRFAGA
jgi:hypothetical protein